LAQREIVRVFCQDRSSKEALVAIVAGFDVHRRQITFDALDAETGEVSRGRIASTRAAVSAWVGRFPGQEVEVALEACTGWLFVCEALAQAGACPHLAEPAETSARRGKKRRAKTDRADACHLRELLCQGRLPESWLPPAHVREWRTRTRLRKTLVDERTQWLQRIRATLFHHGVSVAEVPERLLSRDGRAFLEQLALPAAARERITVALALIETIETQLAPIEHELRSLARRQPGCQALMRQFGVGELLAATILCELGDVSRLSSSRKAVRAVGLDVGVHRSDRRSWGAETRPALSARPAGVAVASAFPSLEAAVACVVALSRRLSAVCVAGASRP